MNGVNVADCWVLPQGVSAVEMTLAVTNATQVRCAIPPFQFFQPSNPVHHSICWKEFFMPVADSDPKTQGFYTDYNMTAFTEPDCSGTAQSFWGPVDSSDPLIKDDWLYQTGCYHSPSGATWQSYYVWNIAAYEKLYPGGGGP